MSPVTVVWSMIASACLTLALIHAFVWFRQRSAWANLAFVAAAVNIAAVAACELATMRAADPRAYGDVLRWAHLPIFGTIVSLMAFVRLYCRAGRLWLLWAFVGVRGAALVLNFTTGESLNYGRIDRLLKVPLLGEPVAVPVGPLNPFMLVGNLAQLLFVAFVVDAAVTVWRRGDRRLALVAGGSIALFAVGGTAQTQLVFWAGAAWPIIPSPFYLGIVLAMSWELGNQALTADRLAGDLREVEQRMTLAAEATGLGVWVRDPVRGTAWASDQWRALFGFAAAEPLSFERFVDRIHPDDREPTRRAVAAGERAGAYEVDYRIVLPDGRTRWVASRGRAEVDAGGRVTRVVGVAQDVTGRKLADAELQAARERSAHLLRAASLGELSSALAHELNQPLMAIMSNAQAALRLLDRGAADPDELRDILHDIVADDEHASAVIRRLRALLKGGGLRPRAVAPGAIVDDVLRLTRGELVARGVAVAVEVQVGLPAVAGDDVALQQVLINLVLNARDAMDAVPPGGRRLTVLAARDDADAAVRFSVIDTGRGIPPGDEERVFEPYHTTKPHGLGLGLSLSRSIVVAHGGTLTAERPAAGGTAFTFTVPEARDA